MLKTVITLLFFCALFSFTSIAHAQEENTTTTIERSFEVQNEYLLPTQVNEKIEPTPPTFFQQIQNLVSSITSLFGFTPVNKEQYTAEVDTRGQAFLYDGFEQNESSPTGNIVEETAETAGQEHGTITGGLPTELKSETDTTCDGAKISDQAWFPENISIISTDCK